MRLDKYLKVSRIIKRRTVANDACDAGRVLVNGKPARASYDVKIGDVLELQLGSRSVKAEVLSVNEYAKKESADEMYKILSDEPNKL
jgi:ribosomal 50S subunit-recycling heat shock protein